MEKRAQLLLEVPKGGGVLEMDIEQGPGVFPGGEKLEARDSEGRAFAEWTIEGRTTVRVSVPESRDGSMQRLEMYVPGGGGTLLNDPRVLNFLFVRAEWVETPAPEASPPDDSELALASIEAGGAGGLDESSRARALKLLGGGSIHVFGPGLGGGGAGWHGLEQFGHLKLQWVADDASLKALNAVGERTIALLVEPGPGVEYKPFDLQVKNSDDDVVASLRVDGLTYLELPLVLPMGASQWRLSVPGGGMVVSDDPRLLNFRVYACGLVEPGGEAAPKWHGMRSTAFSQSPTDAS